MIDELTIVHECDKQPANGHQILSRDGGRTWLMPWYDTSGQTIKAIRINVTHCPFCGDDLKAMVTHDAHA